MIFRIWQRVRYWFRRQQFDRELDEELNFHLEMKTRQHIEGGMAPEEAQVAAQREFGNTLQHKESSRETWIVQWLELFAKDLRFGSRLLVKHPFSNLVIILTIALLVGTVSTIYASLRNQEAKLEPFPQADQLVKFWRTSQQRTVDYFPYEFFEAFRREATSFSALGALRHGSSKTMTSFGEPQTYSSKRVTTSLLLTSGLPPFLGRFFTEDELAPGGEKVAIVSHQLWSEKLGADEAIIGKSIRLNDENHIVVGVLAPEMQHTRISYMTDLWLPLRKSTNPERPTGEVTILGRLQDGVPPSEARAEIEILAAHLEKEHTPSEFERRVYPGGFSGAQIASLSKNLHLRNRSVRGQMIGLWIFTGGIMSSVVLIACFNITNLLLARASSRAREIAIRLALGAKRSRIIRQLLTESFLLSLLGGSGRSCRCHLDL